MFLLVILFVILLYSFSLYLISYAMVTIALKRLTDNRYIRTAISLILASLAGYLLLNTNSGELFDTTIKPMLVILTLASFFYLLHNRFKRTETRRKDLITPARDK